MECGILINQWKNIDGLRVGKICHDKKLLKCFRQVTFISDNPINQSIK